MITKPIKQRKLKMTNGKIKLQRYKRNQKNSKMHSCMTCEKMFPLYEMIRVKINDNVYYAAYGTRKQIATMCQECYEIFRNKILSFDNMNDIVRTIELEAELLKLHSKYQWADEQRKAYYKKYMALRKEKHKTP